MKKILLRAALITCVAGFFTVAGYGQPGRITFKRGASNAVVSGTLSSYRGVRSYLVRVAAGQTLTTEQIGRRPGPITIEIIAPSGEPYRDDLDLSCHNRRNVTPTVAGDYLLRVVECRKASPWRGRFSFRIRVR